MKIPTSLVFSHQCFITKVLPLTLSGRDPLNWFLIPSSCLCLRHLLLFPSTQSLVNSVIPGSSPRFPFSIKRKDCFIELFLQINPLKQMNMQGSFASESGGSGSGRKLLSMISFQPSTTNLSLFTPYMGISSGHVSWRRQLRNFMEVTKH